MIDFVDPIQPIVSFLSLAFADKYSIYGNFFPMNLNLPAVLIRQTGGIGSYRIQMLARANTDYEAMQVLVETSNYFERYSSQVKGLRIIWVSRESHPLTDNDRDSGFPECWCYMNVEALEA